MSRKRTRQLSIVVLVSIIFPLLLSLYVPIASFAATRQIEVQIDASRTPGFYWCQHSDKHWSTSDSYGKYYTAANYVGPDGQDRPARTSVTLTFNMPSPSGQWEDKGDFNNTYPASKVVPSSIKLATVVDAGAPLNSKPSYSWTETLVTISATVGGGDILGRESDACGGNPGYVYLFPSLVTWEGIVEEEVTVPQDQFLGLEIEPTSSTIYVGDTQSYRVFEKWNRGGISTRTQVPIGSLSWDSSNMAKATVNTMGVAIGKEVTTSDIDIIATYAVQNDSVRAKLKVIARPAYNITGDFDILPSSTINWGDSFSFQPKNFNIPAACTYLHHEFRIDSSGTWTSSRISSQSSSSNFSYSSYPHSLSVGSNYVQIRVTATCPTGTIDSGWTAGKYLTINTRPNNAPPQFSAGFFKEYNRSGILPDYEVAIGTRVNLRIIEDITKDPAWPYDPDGDPITYTWLFADSTSSWIRSLPSEYGVWEHDEIHQNLLTTELGSHSITVIARDSFGAETRRNVSIYVIPPNPIPIIDGPTEVKENRALPSPFSGSRSYSPMGRTISQYIWENKLDRYPNVGTEKIKLEVVDSAGLRSLYAAEHTLTILPDEPPVAVVEVDPLAIRDESYNIINKSYSIDGDQIVKATYRYKYDAANNGFDDDEWKLLVGDLTKSQIKPLMVGKFLIELTVEEDYGKTDSATTILDVVNLAPAVSFIVEGKNDVPEPPNKYVIPPNRILSSWPLYEVNTNTALINKPYMWTKDGDKLLAGLGKGMEQQYVHPMSYYFGNNHTEAHTVFPLFTDNGYGPNSISPYRALAARDAARSGPILVPVKGNYSTSYTTDEDYAALNPAQFSSMIRTNQTHIVFDQKIARSYYRNGSDYTYASPVILGLNKSRIPRYASEIAVNTSNPYNVTTKLVHKWLDANPYDYAIELGKRDRIPYYSQSDMSRDRQWQTKAAAGDYSGASSMTDGFPEIPIYEVSGSRLYAVYTIGSNATYAYYSCCDSDGWSETSYGAGGSRYFDIHTYDLKTGEFLGSSYQNGERVVNPYSGSSSYKPMMKGENLVLIYSQFAANVYFEFDRNGKLVKSGNVSLQPFTITHAIKSKNYYGQIITGTPATYVCSWNPHYNSIWKDDKGNFYSYKVVSCTLNGSAVNFDMSLNPEVPQGIYMVQLKSDYTLGGIHKISGDSVSRQQVGMYDFMKENNPILFYNPVTTEMVTRSYSSIYCSGCMFPTVTEYANVINLNAGTVGSWWLTPLRHFSETFSPGFHVTHSGAYGSGWRTASASGTLDKHNYYANREMSRDTTSYTFNNKSTTVLRYGEYAGDGMWLSIYGGSYQGSGPGFSQGGTSNESYMFLDTGTASTAQAYKTFQFGQFVSPDANTDAEYSFTINMDKPTVDTKLAGFSFRMTDPRNRYAVETDGASIALAKYVSGARTVLESRAIAMQPKTNYRFKVVVQGERIQVFLGGVPYFDRTDGSFPAGKFGPFSDKSYVSFDLIEARGLDEEEAQWLTSYAIWEEGGVEGEAQAEVRYSEILFEDPEDDARAGDYQWAITHTPKFINNQGLSALHGQTFTSPTLIFDKVGDYRIGLRAKDDPNDSYPYPDMTFDEYRKSSNEFFRIVTVHRRPIACFILSIHATTKNVTWTDCSYDPDRWASSTNYSTETTGINYQTTRGVLEHRYYFVDPDGVWYDEKLVTPTKTGQYTVGLQVKDEFGAWSYWTEQEIQITIPVTPNQPPVPGFTITPGTGGPDTVFTIKSTASDPEDGPAAAGKIKHSYYIRDVTRSGMEQAIIINMGQDWTVSSSYIRELGTYEIRQVVTDTMGVVAQIKKTFLVNNRPPIAQFTWTPVMVWEGDNIYLVNQSSDPDGDTLTYLWTIVDPNGATTTFTILAPTLFDSVPGNYRVTLQIRDPHGAESSVTKTITVGELMITGYVGHTDAWNENRRKFNKKYPDEYRADDVFWAGERFVLTADTTDTSTESNVKAESVWVTGWGSATPRGGDYGWHQAWGILDRTLSTKNAGRTHWYGEINDPVKDGFLAYDWAKLEHLGNGYLDFVFNVRYSNGVTKSHTVRITILNKWTDYYQIHRVQ